jgi:hypothetical protein
MMHKEDGRADEDREALMTLLRQTRTTTIDDLMVQSGMSWPAVFGIVDRLSRDGGVVLSKAGSQYRISLEDL